MTNEPKLSVVVCFKDWGLDRLIGVSKSILSSNLGDQLEIIVADYGSSASQGFRDELEAIGVRYFYFETNGIWSRSRALNLGIAQARGEYIATTDADMVFTPRTFPRVLELLEMDHSSYFLLQCRDLPEGITHSDVLEGKVGWADLENVSTLRPRWGMGGLIAFPRDAYTDIRGLDERLQIYGGEDIDLAKRLNRLGLRRIWIDEPPVRMYHIWHPSSLVAAESSTEGTEAVRANRSIHQNDLSTIRNTASWLGKPRGLEPLITVAISTYNRSEYLRESIDSVLAQTVQDIEVVVVNDGSTDQTADVLASIDDPRLRVLDQENLGLAAARNRITSVARGKFIAIHDDDDIMLPDRLENQLKMLGSGVSGAYGGWVDFDNGTGDLKWNRGKAFSLESLAYNTGVLLHPTLLVDRRLMEHIPYDESMRSGSDYNLAIRLARSGAKFAHCGEYVLLRRQHDGQITNTHGNFQKVSGRVSGAFARSTFSPELEAAAKSERGRKDWVEVSSEEATERKIRAYLPDHLTERGVRFSIEAEDVARYPWLKTIPGLSGDGEIVTRGGSEAAFTAPSLKLRDLFRLQSAFGKAIEVVSPAGASDEEAEVRQDDQLSCLAPLVKATLRRLPAGSYRLFQYPASALHEVSELPHWVATVHTGQGEAGISTAIYLDAPEARWNQGPNDCLAAWSFKKKED